MTRRTPFVLACALALASACLAAEPAPATASAPAGDLRQALRDYYVHLLVQELAVAPEKAPSVEGALDRVITTQRDAGAERVRLDLDIAALVGRPDDPLPANADPAAARALLERARTTEAASVRRVSEAREGLVKQLTPAQAVRFLAFEQRFRERVREIIAQRRGGGGKGPAGQGWRGGGPDARREGTPARPEGGDARPGDGEAHDQDGPDPPQACIDEAVETMKMLFAHAARQSLDLPRERAVDLMPALDQLVTVQVTELRERRTTMRSLRRLARDPEAPEAELRARVDAALRLDAGAAKAIADARRAVLDQLSPVEGARFLLVEQRFQREAGPRLRELLRCGRPQPPGPGADSAPRR